MSPRKISLLLLFPKNRVHTKRNVTNITSLGNAHAVMDEDDDSDPDGEEPDLATETV